jgi:hypothetical protein
VVSGQIDVSMSTLEVIKCRVSPVLTAGFVRFRPLMILVDERSQFS